MRVFSYVFGSVLTVIAINFSAATTPQYCPFQNRNLLPSFLQNAGDFCSPKNQKCDPNNIYYTFDGSCNNLLFPNWGQTRTPYTRITPANYSDGLSAFRKSSDGSPLPLPRVITTTILLNRDIVSPYLNIMFYGFGQWLDHDVTHQLPVSTPNPCCSRGQLTPNMPDACIPIVIPNNDYFYSKFGINCFDLKRSISTQTLGCSLKPIYQINFETGAIDLSILYGPDDATAASLRLFYGGLLKTSVINGQSYPPVVSGLYCPAGGYDAQPYGQCFLAGDERINTNPELFMTSVCFVNSHNYIAQNLGKINPKWSDEKIYQESRRILIAMYQNIVYREHVPLLIGPFTTWLNRLYPNSYGYASGYDVNTNIQTFEHYEAAIGRILHSLIAGVVNYIGPNGTPSQYKLRNKYFAQQFCTYPNASANMIKAFTTQPCSNQDEYFTEEVNNYLYFFPGAKYGLDLPAIDITRGRDHGLAPYNIVRQACGLCRLNSFEDLRNEIKDPTDVEKLKAVYKNVNDIDLYVGSIIEKPLPGAAVGPTAACVLAESFRRWKSGDRFFHEFPTAKFTPGQLATIRNATFSLILCWCNPTQKYVYKNSFVIPSPQNPLIPCSDVPQVDFSQWKDPSAARG